jgi:hypothetical protein
MDAYSPKVAVRGDASAERPCPAMPCHANVQTAIPPRLLCIWLQQIRIPATLCSVFCSASSPTAATADPRARDDPEQNGKSCLSETFLSADCRPRRQSPHPPRLASPHLTSLARPLSPPSPSAAPHVASPCVEVCVGGRAGVVRVCDSPYLGESLREIVAPAGRDTRPDGTGHDRLSFQVVVVFLAGRFCLFPSLCPQAKPQSPNWKYRIGCRVLVVQYQRRRPASPAGENGKPT